MSLHLCNSKQWRVYYFDGWEDADVCRSAQHVLFIRRYSTPGHINSCDVVCNIGLQPLFPAYFDDNLRTFVPKNDDTMILWVFSGRTTWRMTSCFRRYFQCLAKHFHLGTKLFPICLRLFVMHTINICIFAMTTIGNQRLCTAGCQARPLERWNALILKFHHNVNKFFPTFSVLQNFGQMLSIVYSTIISCCFSWFT